MIRISPASLCLMAILTTLLPESAFGQPVLPANFLNARGLSSLDQANDYYANIDPTETERRSCAIFGSSSSEREESKGSVKLTDQGVPQNYTPGLQLRVFFNSDEGEKSVTRLISSVSPQGVHFLEDGPGAVPLGQCLEYQLIGASPTLGSWLDRAFGPGSSGDFVGRSQNVQDLGFGRYTSGGVRNDEIFTYVQNFLSLQEAVNHPGPRAAPNASFATVAIEYSRTQPGSGPRTLKYFIYNQEGVRTAKLDLDGRGQKYVPNVCSICHSDQFLPIDLDSQRFSNQSGATRADQEEEFYQLNQLLLQSDPPDQMRELIDGWYLSSHQQESDFVPQAWESASDLYLDFVKPYCRACHVTQDRDWFPDPDYARSFSHLFAFRVCDSTRPMPNALETWALLALDSTAIETFERETEQFLYCLRDNIDFEARIPEITPTEPEVGDQLLLRLEVLNAGELAFQGSAAAQLRVTDPAGNQTELDLSFGSLAPGENQEFLVPQNVNQEGRWTFRWRVDSNNEVREYPDFINDPTRGYTNNVAIAEIDVGPAAGGDLPNLIMTPIPTSITMTPQDPEAGEVITFTIRILNEGPGPTPQNLLVQHRIQVGSQVSFRSCGSTAPGNDCEFFHSVIAAPGLNQRIRVTADTNHLVDETEEGDNTRSLYFNVPTPTSTITCQGTWQLTGDGHDFNSSSAGSLVNNCDVYWGENQPTSTCFVSEGIDDMVVTWFRDGNACPVRASAYRPRDNRTFLFNVNIVP